MFQHCLCPHSPSLRLIIPHHVPNYVAHYSLHFFRFVSLRIPVLPETLWARTIKNPDCSTGPLVRLFACTAHSFAYCTLLALLVRSAALTPLLARSLRSLPRLWESESFDGYLLCVFFYSGPKCGVLPESRLTLNEATVFASHSARFSCISSHLFYHKAFCLSSVRR